MQEVTHYDVLGVAPTASAGEIRKAYVAAARRAHPDVAGAAGDDRMRDLNSAWSVLSDPAARRHYDLTLDVPAAPQRTTVHRPTERPFVPYNAVDEDDDDAWRYTDDATDPETAPGTFLQLAPLLLVGCGIAAVIVGGLVKLTPLMALGGILGGLGVVGFLIVPLMVMSKASTVEQRRERERGR